MKDDLITTIIQLKVSNQKFCLYGKTLFLKALSKAVHILVKLYNTKPNQMLQ